MYDPVGGFERIIEQFQAYLDTAFRINDPQVAEARRRLLSEPGQLSLDPIFEAVPRYVQWDHGLEELLADSQQRLFGFSPREREAFVNLALAGLFEAADDQDGLGLRSAYRPYRHQIEMLSRGTRDGHPGIVTSGTGSGKTESFLLPIFAQLAKEAIRWPAPTTPVNDDWLNPRQRFRFHRAGEHRDRPKALRAILLYPLNALVEDQMVRLRKALDSDQARNVMDNYFHGNRIYFGRYTGKSPATGPYIHPRLAQDDYWKERKRRTTDKLRQELRVYRDIQARIAVDPGLRDEDREELRYIFPSTDGGEMISRWDMQETPPDILVTNQSILNAMLVREVDSPIIEKTREWLENDPEARFFLVLDELHLIRGSSGAEMASLLRVLLDRLGLSDPQRAHKLRILASSASLPMDDANAESSLKYLKNLFGSAGTTASVLSLEDTWSSSIVTGESVHTALPSDRPDTAALLRIAAELDRVPHSEDRLKTAVLKAAKSIRPNTDETDQVMLERATAVAAAMLDHALHSEDGVRSPGEYRTIGKRLFGPDQCEAARGLMVLRAIPDLPHGVLSNEQRPRRKVVEGLPSFRMHCFVRNIEGMFASLTLDADGEPSWGEPSIERGQDSSRDGSLRLFEMLYCEACGELYAGGKRGEVNDKVSLLPSPQELERLPEEASTMRFEDASYADFALFWPRSSDAQAEQSDNPKYHWNNAFLDPATGIVGLTNGPGFVPGRILHRPDGKDAHSREKTDDGTAVPYCCAKCGTDYSWRFRAKNSQRREGRLSPIRSFRTGFGKTSQLLATELTAALKAQGGDGKLVAFSDSREDAANLALDVEIQHQTDLRREVLITAAKRIASQQVFTDEHDRELDALTQELREALGDDTVDIDDLNQKVSQLRRLKNQHQYPRSVPLTQLFEFARGRRGDEVRPIVAELLSIGATPTKGADTKKNRVRGEPWHRFFEINDEITWKVDAPGTLHDKVDSARTLLEKQQKPEATDLLFSKTYFALEETGLGWPSFFGPVEYTPAYSILDAWLRILADAYRVIPNQFDEDVGKAWNNAHDVLGRTRSGRLANLAKKLFADPDASIDEFLTTLRETLGHGDTGTVDVTKLYFRLSNSTDAAWRCDKCARVHLHRGFGQCTRCGEALPHSTELTADHVARQNFLGRRVLRSMEGEERLFRLKCEELTGQTKDQGARLQQFKGVFVPEDGEAATEFAARRKFEEADLLSVTTTMEVGVDIGSLQAVYQGNMPPQRFNYQQRVGRAGRRGQAFSSVLTVCRSKSHDIHYFRNPIKMTGEAPPPPFITTELIDIPSRLLRKFWLVAAFNWLRREAERQGEAWVADKMVPADIHGEFIYTLDYFAPESDWPEKLRKALEATRAEYRTLSEMLSAGAGCDVNDVRSSVTSEALIEDIEKLRDEYDQQSVGLASALAERGLFPLYGMPTSTRNLYVEPMSSGFGMEAVVEWDTIDRSQEMAIFDFAPGSVRTREKLYHKAVGFTGTLPEITAHFQDDLDQPIAPFGSWRRDHYSLAYCRDCGVWSRGAYGTPNCKSCGGDLAQDALTCVTPTAYRTDFRPSRDSLPSKIGQRLTLASLGEVDKTVSVGNLRVNFAERSEIYMVNPGQRIEEGFSGFSVKEVIDTDVRHLKNFPKRPILKLADQAVAEEVVENERQRWRETSDTQPEKFWLSSQKITNSLQIGALQINPLLRIANLDGGLPDASSRMPEKTSVRAAAISATEIIVHRAALELDIAPEEFDALAPYAKPEPGGRLTPFLQIADSLPNGSGFCRHLLGDSSLPVARLIESILDEASVWPRTVLDKGSHASHCRTSCYECLQRYNNRNYHGLLDWRLGLSYLRALIDPEHVCGLDGNFDFFELRDWLSLAQHFADHSSTFVPGNRQRTVGTHLKLPAFSVDPGNTRWAVIVHPLWHRHGLMEHLGLSNDCIALDTFELARRPLQAIDRLRRVA